MAKVIVDSIAEQLVAALREEILSGAMKPGDQLNLEQVATRWDISMTPVRDAVRALEEKGFVRIKPRVGVFVSEMDVQSFREVFEIRIALECQAVKSAIRRLPKKEIEEVIAKYKLAAEKAKSTGDVSLLAKHDELVHQLIEDYCENKRLVALMHELKDLVRWVRRTVVQHLSHAYEAAVEEHLEILDALERQDETGAESAMRRHLQKSCERTIAAW
jgi:DNA-binding GntR family transcriptional regulator